MESSQFVLSEEKYFNNLSVYRFCGWSTGQNDRFYRLILSSQNFENESNIIEDPLLLTAYTIQNEVIEQAKADGKDLESTWDLYCRKSIFPHIQGVTVERQYVSKIISMIEKFFPNLHPKRVDHFERCLQNQHSDNVEFVIKLISLFMTEPNEEIIRAVSQTPRGDLTKLKRFIDVFRDSNLSDEVKQQLFDLIFPLVTTQFLVDELRTTVVTLKEYSDDVLKLVQILSPISTKQEHEAVRTHLRVLWPFFKASSFFDICNKLHQEWQSIPSVRLAIDKMKPSLSHFAEVLPIIEFIQLVISFPEQQKELVIKILQLNEDQGFKTLALVRALPEEKRLKIVNNLLADGLPLLQQFFTSIVPFSAEVKSRVFDFLAIYPVKNSEELSELLSQLQSIKHVEWKNMLISMRGLDTNNVLDLIPLTTLFNEDFEVRPEIEGELKARNPATISYILKYSGLLSETLVFQACSSFLESLNWNGQDSWHAWTELNKIQPKSFLYYLQIIIALPAAFRGRLSEALAQLPNSSEGENDPLSIYLYFFNSSDTDRKLLIKTFNNKLTSNCFPNWAKRVLAKNIMELIGQVEMDPELLQLATTVLFSDASGY